MPPAHVTFNNELSGSNTSLARLLSLARAHGSQFNGCNWATCVHRIAKFHVDEARTHGRLQEVLDLFNHLSELFPNLHFQHQHMATLLWSMARLEQLLNHGSSSSSSSASQQQRLLRDALVTRLLGDERKLKPQDLANTIWALNRLGDKRNLETVLPVFERAVRALIGNFKTMEISSILWSLAQAELRPSQETLALLEVEYFRSTPISDYTPQGVANILQALAAFKVGAEYAFVQLVAAEIRRNPRKFFDAFKPQEISLLLAAMAQLRAFEVVGELSRKFLEFSDKHRASMDLDTWLYLSCGAVGNFEVFALGIAKRLNSALAVHQWLKRATAASAVSGGDRKFLLALALGVLIAGDAQTAAVLRNVADGLLDEIVGNISEFPTFFRPALAFLGLFKSVSAGKRLTAATLIGNFFASSADPLPTDMEEEISRSLAVEADEGVAGVLRFVLISAEMQPPLVACSPLAAAPAPVLLPGETGSSSSRLLSDASEAVAESVARMYLGGEVISDLVDAGFRLMCESELMTEEIYFVCPKNSIFRPATIALVLAVKLRINEVTAELICRMLAAQATQTTQATQAAAGCDFHVSELLAIYWASNHLLGPDAAVTSSLKKVVASRF